MSSPDASTLTALVLRVATQLIEGIDDGVAARGFTDVRPAHGFAFVRISVGGATTVEVAEHLGVTKQAASQLVEQLVQRGYVRREPDPADGRARRLQLTERGWACTRAAEQAAADLITTWQQRAGAQALAHLHQGLQAVAEPGPLRPAW